MKEAAMKYLTVVIAVVILGSALTRARGGEQRIIPQATVEQSLTGTVTCTGRVTHRYLCRRNQTLQSCTLACVEQGSKFVLMVADKPYVLDGNSSDIEGYAGGKATVIGLVSDGDIQVHRVSGAK